MMEDSLDLEPGKTVSHFRLEQLLGEGGMGAVYLAEDLTLSRRVAIKFMRRSLLANTASAQMRESLEQRFIREAKSAAAINHPNLAQIYEANFDTDNWFIAMEFINGSALDDMLSEGKLYSVADIVSITRQTVSGLDFAWQNYKIIHRDIKPQNIMLTKDNLVKIVDLGLAKPMASAEEDYEMPELTCAGTPLGTPQYMAPEQATGDTNIDFRADIFALGATIYEILTGKKAFSGATAPMIYMSQIQKKYTPISELRDDIPDALIDLLNAMLEPQQNERIATYAEILERLSNVPLDAASDQSGVFQSYYEPSPTMATMVASRAGAGEGQSMFYPTDKLIRERYRILKPIGKGRAGMVYHCLDTQTGVECAVKSLFPGREFPEQEMPRIKENFQRLMGMNHPNLVQIRDLQTDRDTGELFVVTEMMTGQNLREYSHKMVSAHGSITIEMVTPVLTNVAMALDSLNSTFQRIHHDLKPESIFLIDNDAGVKLLDYGVTYPSDDENTIPPDDLYRFPIATPDYMSPEMWKRQEVSLSSDQYSFAVVVYELLSRRLPFWIKDPLPDSEPDGDDNTTTEPSYDEQLRRLFTRVTTESARPVDGLRRNENAALLKALAKTPTERFASCEEFVRSISGTGAGTGKALWAVAAALIVAGILAFMATRQEPESTGTEHGRPAEIASPPSESIPTTIAPTAAEQAAAEEAARLKAQRQREVDEAKRRAERIARDEELALLRKTAEGAKAQYTRMRTELVDAPDVKARLAAVDDIAKPAVKAYVEGDFESAVKHYQSAIDALKDIEALLKQREREKMEAVRKQAIQEHDLYADERLELMKDSRAVPLLERAKESADLGKILLEQEEFSQALDNFKAARDALNDVRNQVAELAERQLAEQRERAAELKQQFVELRLKLAKRPEAEPFLARPDELAQQAKEYLKNEELVRAVRQYQEAIDACHDVTTEIKHILRKEALALQAECSQQRREIMDFEKLSPEIAQQIVKCDVSLGAGRTEVKREEYETAIEHFNAAATIMTAVSTISKEKFEAVTGRDFTVPEVGMEFVWIEPMKMWVGKYEVTNGEYRVYQSKHDSKKEEGFSLNGDRQPALWLSYFNAVAFCQWLNVAPGKASKLPDGYEFRLPTGDEWRQFAQCGSDRKYPWGSEWPPSYGNFANQEVFPSQWRLDGYTSDQFPVTCPVEESGRNEWGLYGVAGNVWEWTSQKKSNTQAVRGGGWTECTSKTLEIDVEAFAPASDLYDNIGFRVVVGRRSN